MEQTVKERLIEFLKYKGYSQGRLEKELGWSNGYINSVRNNMGSQKLQTLLGKFPDLSQNWLINGYGEMIKPEIELGEDGKIHIKKEDRKQPENEDEITTSELRKEISVLNGRIDSLIYQNKKLIDIIEKLTK